MESNSWSLNRLLNPSGWSLLIFLGLSLTLLASIFLDVINTSYLLLSALVSGICGYIVVPILRKIKASQVIQKDGLQSHLKKAGTPTMGGIFFIPTAVIFGWIFGGFTPEVIAVGLVTLGYGFIGWIDDWQILRKKNQFRFNSSAKVNFSSCLGFNFFCLDVIHST